LNRLFVLLFVVSSATAFLTNPRYVGSTQCFSSANPVDSSVKTSDAENDLLPEYQEALDEATATVSAAVEKSNPKLLPSLMHFCKEYISASQTSNMKTKDDISSPKMALKRILEGVQFGFKFGMGPNKMTFGAMHDALRGDPEKEDGNKIDFYTWGCDFFRPFIDLDESKMLGMENLQKVVAQIEAGENVIFLANHQSEADPQVVSIMLEKAGFAEQAEKVVYVAGHKVTTDPLAIPFSMGRNLVCIHSKKHIDADPDTKSVKTRQNMAAMSSMLGKLKKGGCVLWVAPSGGRDRRDVKTGKTPMASFDPKTIDLFRLMGNKSKMPTHYYPFAMVSYELCPPPDFIEAGVGEQRNFRFVNVGIKVGDELVSPPGGMELRHEFSERAYAETLKDYYELRELIFPGTAPEP
jgi:glycerol-3-phosphate O-acyltransferase